MKRLRSRSSEARAAFTIIELVVAVGITAAVTAFVVAILTNVSGFWSRTSGRLSAEAQARHVLDQVTLDLQGALYRDDGNTWLAATIPANTNNTFGLWNTTGATAAATKPANAAGSLQNTFSPPDGPPSPLSAARFGVAGTWLRFFTTKRGGNRDLASASAPVAVAYQIVRRGTTATANNPDRRYLLHRTEVTPANTLAAGFNVTAGAYTPTSGNPPAAAGTARELRLPTLNSVIAENVIDFGVRLHVYAPNSTTGALELTQVFPSANGDLTHLGRLPPRIPNSGQTYTDCFPEVVDVMVRVLTDEGARLIAGYEANPQRVTAAAGRTPQQYWWDLALAHSQVFTRRIVLPTHGI
jgi:type II secretory pathway pseudopilin PulG